MKKLIIETKEYKDIPYSEYYLEGVSSKNLVFIQHGYQSDKEYGADYLALTLSRLGHKVIAIDAYKHGERIEEPYISGKDSIRYAEIFHVVDRTADDIISIYDGLFSKEYNKFDLIGVSMGGFIAYMVALRTDKVNKLVPTITTPMFHKLATFRHNVPDIDEYQKEVEQHLPYIESLDAYSQRTNLQYKKMLLLNGEKDPIIPVEDTIEFFHQMNDSTIKMHIYDEVHEVNREMQKAIFEFIDNEKVVL